MLYSKLFRFNWQCLVAILKLTEIAYSLYFEWAGVRPPRGDLESVCPEGVRHSGDGLGGSQT